MSIAMAAVSLPAHSPWLFLPMSGVYGSSDALYRARAACCHLERLGGEGPVGAPRADRAGITRDSFFSMFQGSRPCTSMLRFAAFSAARRETSHDRGSGHDLRCRRTGPGANTAGSGPVSARMPVRGHGWLDPLIIFQWAWNRAGQERAGKSWPGRMALRLLGRTGRPAQRATSSQGWFRLSLTQKCDHHGLGFNNQGVDALLTHMGSVRLSGRNGYAILAKNHRHASPYICPG